MDVTEAERRAGNLDRVAEFFREHPGEWIESRLLEAVGGRCAWRTRVSECRTQRGMRIENRQQRKGAAVLSFYRFVPASAPQQPALFSFAGPR